MTKEFIQVTCTKANGDFIICSNLSMMEHKKLSSVAAKEELEAIAVKAAADGYDVSWTKEVLTAEDLEWYGDLFEMAA
jgi:hypothetical protein